MNARALLIAILTVALQAHASCPVSSFGAEKEGACARDRCARTKSPSPDVQEIRRGIYFEYVSLELVPTDMKVWLALDVDRGEVMYIQQYPGRSYEKLLQAQKQESADTRVSVRKVRKVVHYTRYRAIAPERLDEIVCLANAMWKAKEIDGVRAATDVYTQFLLLDGVRAKSVDGLGIAGGDVKKMEALLEAAKGPGWEWWNVF